MKSIAQRFFFLSLPFFIGCISPRQKRIPMIVNVPVADVRSDQSLHNDKYEYDDKQETQILQGEEVAVHEIQGEWARIECPEQIEYTHKSQWEGYPGWTQLKNLSSDTGKKNFPKAPAISEEKFRAALLTEARRFIGAPYMWGGRSLYDPNNTDVLTGVDCSGLINWSFRQLGRTVPRDAHEQFMKAQRKEPADLKPGDLFFLAKTSNPQKIVHVGFISDGDKLIEAPQSGERVREITFQERFGKKRNELSNGAVVGDRIIYFGTLLTGGL